ncbi:MAG: PadR family transcriptional regulator [Oscillospiraceae bacterium]|nr:PadR family transcriptional regulator [Oscillospiraceae bacterium]
MPRAKFQTLTEQMFYILLCLREECCGMDILDRVPAMTEGRVSVGSGTLYNLLEQFAQAGMIRETRVEGRRRSYLLTDFGRETLRREYRRIRAQADDYDRWMGKEWRQ